jgi:hypothetical protein
VVLSLGYYFVLRFRIFQETLTNFARHVDATEVDVRLVKDNGVLGSPLKPFQVRAVRFPTGPS